MSESKKQNEDRIAQELAGFTERQLWTFSRDRACTFRVELWLPISDEINEYVDSSYQRANFLELQNRQEQEALKQQIEQQKVVASGASVDSEVEVEDDLDAARNAAKKAAPKLSKREQDEQDRDVAVQTRLLQARAAKDVAELAHEEWYPVYAPLEPLKILDSSRQAFGDRGQSLDVYRNMRAKGHMRPLARMSVDRADEIFLELDARYPLHTKVTEFVRDQHRLCQRRGLPLHLSPILLAGPAGTGKTAYTKALAEAIGASYHELGFDTERTSSAFLGSSAHWGNTQPGIVYRALAMDENSSANPIVLLDELCKSRSGGYQDPLASLHGLLEPVSNKKVTDISVSIEFDASLISWIATANDLSKLLPSLLSRFRIFIIMPALDGATGLKLAAEMVRRTHNALAIDGFQEPGKDVIRCVASLMVPRVMRVALEMAYGTASAQGRMAFTAKDFEKFDPDHKPQKVVYH